jgi:hypothetical protein
MEKFNQEQREAQMAAKYERLSRYEAFDALIDMALDGQVTFDEAISAWREREGITDGGGSNITKSDN